ncbi:sensor histidine kinase [Cognatilysobacter bugurensis]
MEHRRDRAGVAPEIVAPANVLIVDDVPQNLLALEAVLRDEQVNILTAASGAEALELLLRHEVAVAILDVHMPEMSGFALAELMRASPRTAGIPIIFLTASPRNAVHAFRGYDAGAVDFLHKPIEAQIIQGKVQVFVQLHRQRQLLALRAERLEQVLSLNETMLAVITHDLRTPLSAVSLCGDALVRLPGESRSHVIGQRIQRSTRRMSRMIDQLLDFTRIRSGVMRIEPRPADLGAVARQVIDEVRQAHPEQAIHVAENGDLGGTFDPDRLGQVLSNLVGNAAQHAGGDEVQVLLDGCAADRLSVEVINRGRIDDDLLSRLFEPFKGVLHASSGLGLGLYIVDQFVRAHRGTTSARSEDGRVRLSLDIPRHVQGELPTG